MTNRCPCEYPFARPIRPQSTDLRKAFVNNPPERYAALKLI